MKTDQPIAPPTVAEIDRSIRQIAGSPHLSVYCDAGTWIASLVDFERPALFGRGSGAEMIIALERAISDFRCRLAIKIAHELDEADLEPTVDTSASPRHAHADLGGEA